MSRFTEHVLTGEPSMVQPYWPCPSEWSEWSDRLATGLHGRCRWRLSVWFMGMLVATGRWTVAAWLRAAVVTDTGKPNTT